MQTVDPRTISPDVDVGRPRIPESAAPPVPVFTTILFVLAVLVLAGVVIVLATGTTAPTEIHDSWMTYPGYQAASEIHDSWMAMADLTPAMEIHDSWMTMADVAPAVEIHDSWMNTP